MTTLVLDAGALIALDRNDRRVWAMLRVASDDDDPVLVPAGVIAQAWRDGARQALLVQALEHCDEIALDGARSSQPVTSLIAPVVPAGTMASAAQPDIAIDEELVLRPWRATDAAAVLEAFSTPDIQHWHFRRFDNESDARSWIAECEASWSSEKSATWAITAVERDEVLGRVSLYTDLDKGLGEVTYWVLPGARGRRVATRACIAATRWGHRVGLHRIELQHSTVNVASRGVAFRAGFVEEGVQRSALLHAGGWHDMRLYSHLSNDPLP